MVAADQPLSRRLLKAPLQLQRFSDLVRRQAQLFKA
jgi:hypothetical protein